GTMRAGEKLAREKYLNERYGLDRPYLVQYGHWLNNVSPIGFKTYEATDQEVKDSATAADALPRDEKGDKQKPKVRAGDIRWTKPTIKIPDLGNSFTRNRKVLDIVLEAAPISITLEAISLPITYLVAVLSGIYAAKHRGKLFDVGSGTILIA